MSIVIKRYQNRKLYNTQSKRYITLEEIEQLIKERSEIKVIDNQTGDDITAMTLSQIIFELEKSQNGLFPISLLTSLVQSGGKRIDEIRRNIFESMNIGRHYDIEIERRINQLIGRGEITQEEGQKLLKVLLSIGYQPEDFIENIEGRLAEILHERQIPSKSDFQSLLHRIEALSEKVERIKKSSLNNANSEHGIEDQTME